MGVYAGGRGLFSDMGVGRERCCARVGSTSLWWGGGDKDKIGEDCDLAVKVRVLWCGLRGLVICVH